MSILVKFNGEEKQINSLTVSALLFELGLADKKVAIELNKQIIRRDLFDSTSISSGDSIEVVHFVGGG